MTHQKVFVIDFGGQYTQLIVRRVRELGIYSEMVPWTEAPKRLQTEKPAAVILSGGPRSALEDGAPDLDFSLIEGIPTLGICYGMQLMGLRLGGKVEKADHKEYGLRQAEVLNRHGVLSHMESKQVWMSHGDQVLQAPPGYVVSASTDTCPVAAFDNEPAKRFGVQFHP